MLNIKYDYKNYVINGFMYGIIKSITPSSFRVMWIDIIYSRLFYSIVSGVSDFSDNRSV